MPADTATATPRPKVKVRRRFVWIWYTVLAFSFLTGLSESWRDAGTVFSAVIGYAIVIGITELILYSAAYATAKRGVELAQIQQVLHEIDTSPLKPIVVEGIGFQRGEQCYYETSAQVLSPHTTTERVGGYGGLSMPTPIKGVRAHVGGFKAVPVSSTAFANEGPATVRVTNHRVIIAGTFGNRTSSLSSIVGLQPYLDGVKLDIANEKPVLLLSGDIRLAAMITKVIEVANKEAAQVQS